jgi:hypothetical protein
LPFVSRNGSMFPEAPKMAAHRVAIPNSRMDKQDTKASDIMIANSAGR